ncbi:MAG: NfeD family protein [Thermoguttaceae bacterium]
MEPWIWPILLLTLGLGLAVLEVFFPSAGILPLFAAALMLAAVVMGFREGAGVGMTILGLIVVVTPTVIILAFRVWPHTSIGRQMLLEAPRAEDVLPDDPDRVHLKGLIGQLGRAKCRMLPGGIVVIDGRTADAVSEGMVIEAGQQVRVIKVQANRLVVRPVEDETPTESAENPLERPIDSILGDAFRDPLA